MASVVDICNMALARLGDEANVTSISPPDGSDQADHCARFYPEAVKKVLSRHPWNFAKKRVALPKLEDDELYGSWSRFQVPSDSLGVITVNAPELGGGPVEYTIEYSPQGDVLVIRADKVVVTYISSNISSDRFPPFFTDAVVLMLASMLAGPIIKNQTGFTIGEKLLEEYMVSLAKAKYLDAKQRHIIPKYTPYTMEGVQYKSTPMEDITWLK